MGRATKTGAWVVYIPPSMRTVPRSPRLPLVVAVISLTALPALLLFPAFEPGKVLSSADLLLRSYLMEDVRPPGFSPANHLIGDPVLQFMPWHDLASRELRHGRIPFWNPYAEAGEPLLGNAQSAIFDPLGLPALLLGGSRASVATALLRLLVAAFGAFVFARRAGASIPASAISGVAYGCGGFMVVWLLFPHSSSAAWFPWAMVAAESLGRGASVRSAVGLGLFLGLSALGGHLEVAFLGAVAAAVYVLLRHAPDASQAEPRPSAVLAGLALAGAVAFVVCAPVVLPFFESVGQGTVLQQRSHDGTLLSLRGFRWYRAPMLAYPYALGRPVAGEGDVLGNLGNFCENNGGYASVMALALAVLGLSVSPRGSPGRALGWLAAGALVCITSLPPIVPMLRRIPFLGAVPPGRTAFILLFAVAVLAAFGADGMTAASSTRRFTNVRRVLRAVLTLAGLSAMALAVWFILDGAGVAAAVKSLAAVAARALVSQSDRAREFSSDALRLAPVFGSHYLLPWGAATLASAFALGGAKHRRSPLWTWCALVIVAADLYWFGHRFNPAIPLAQHYPVTKQVRQLETLAGEQRVLVLDQALGNPAGLGTEYGWRGVLGYDVIGRRRVESLLGLDGPLPRQTGGFPLLHYDRVTPTVLDVLSVRAVATREPLTDSRLELVAPLGKGFLYRNPDALPPVSLPLRVVVVSDEGGARAALAKPTFDPARTAVVEAPAGTAFQTARGSLRLERPTPNRLEVSGRLDAAGLAVIDEGFDPGWRAWANGRPLRIYPCDLALMAVPLEAGEQSLEFQFVPRTWPIVKGIWLCAAVLVGGGVVATAWRRRRAWPR
jgi:hypothetical protein